MTAFATYQDLGTRMMRSFTPAEQAWVTALLEDAAALMRGEMRNQVYPSRQSTYIAYPVAGRVDLPQSPVVSVDNVTAVADGSEVMWSRIEDSVYLKNDAPVNVTFTFGLASPPADLIAINCALVSGTMLTVGAGLGLNAGGLSSIAIDDFKAAFADGGSQSGMILTEATKKYLQARYGSTTWIVGSR